MATVQDLITDAWVDSGVGGVGETPTAADLAYYLRRLNRLVDSWSNDYLMVYESYDVSLTTSAGVASYASTSLSGSLRPVDIRSARIRADGNDFYLQVISPQEYAKIPVKTSQGLPEVLYPQTGMANATFYLWPVPDQAYTLYLTVPRKFPVYALSDTVALPPGYERAIVSSMVVQICAANNVEVSPAALADMSDALVNIKRPHVNPMLMDAGMGAGRSNIVADE